MQCVCVCVCVCVCEGFFKGMTFSDTAQSNQIFQPREKISERLVKSQTLLITRV